METMTILEQVTELIRNLTFPIAMVCYFAWRDIKYMSKLDSTLDVILKYLEKENKWNGSKLFSETDS